MSNFFIPEPCHENWNKMTPQEQGRHCAVCSKVVVDFTKKTPTSTLPSKSVPLQIAQTVLPSTVQGAAIACAAAGTISIPFAATVFAGSKVIDCALNVIFTEKKQDR